jgi:hypothetical protein
VFCTTKPLSVLHCRTTVISFFSRRPSRYTLSNNLFYASQLAFLPLTGDNASRVPNYPLDHVQPKQLLHILILILQYFSFSRHKCWLRMLGLNERVHSLYSFTQNPLLKTIGALISRGISCYGKRKPILGLNYCLSRPCRLVSSPPVTQIDAGNGINPLGIFPFSFVTLQRRFLTTVQPYSLQKHEVIA